MQVTSNIEFVYNAQMSTGGEDCPNILLHGDNKMILPGLSSLYRNKIKCIYIDPPYNNGDSYYYYNDNSSQSNWLRDIRTVFEHLKQLLTKDGSLWISIDDKEMAYLKIEADRIFGRENYAGTIVWQQRKTRENRAVFSCNHEYILVYTKNLNSFKKSRNLLPVDEDFINSKYKNPDNDPRGPWQSVSASVQAGHAVPSQFYTIVSPAGVEFDPPKGRCWAYNQDRMLREISANNIWFGRDGRNTPRIKKFLSDAKIGLTPETLWAGNSYGTTDSAKKHLLSLFPEVENVFDTPKPEELLKQIIEIASNESDYVLDCYLGSGTTLAVAHKLKRKYIGVEIGEQMTDLVVSRLKSVMAGEEGGISSTIGWQGGGEFAYFEAQRIDKSKLVTTERKKTVPLKSYVIEDDWSSNVIQLSLFEPSALYITKNEKTLIGACRQSAREWVKQSLLYNYPVSAEELQEHPELKRVKQIVVKYRKGVVGYYNVTEYSLVTKKELGELGYPVKSSKHKKDTKYILYKLEENTDKIPCIRTEDCHCILGKGAYDTTVK